MKTILVLAAALGLSVSAAAAACSGHVSASVDEKLTVASVEKDKMPADASTLEDELIETEK